MHAYQTIICWRIRYIERFAALVPWQFSHATKKLRTLFVRARRNYFCFHAFEHAIAKSIAFNICSHLHLVGISNLEGHAFANYISLAAFFLVLCFYKCCSCVLWKPKCHHHRREHVLNHVLAGFNRFSHYFQLPLLLCLCVAFAAFTLPTCDHGVHDICWCWWPWTWKTEELRLGYQKPTSFGVWRLAKRSHWSQKHSAFLEAR